MLENSELEKIIAEWSYWSTAPSPTIDREVLDAKFSFAKDLVVAIQGVRRCGKSTLLTQIMEKYNFPKSDCYFVNFEDPRLSDELHYGLLDQIVSVARSRTSDEQLQFFFFDEIQNIDKWERWFHKELARPKNAIYFITGSNASLLAGDLGSSLTGRHLTIELFPFNFKEYQKALPNGDIDHFLSWGGFPRTLTFPEPAKLLREYFNDIIERDVRRHVAARDPTTLMHLVKSLYESTGSETSQRKIASVLGISADTVGVYIAASKAAYIIGECSYFSFSERQRSARNRKYYPVDNGLWHSISTKRGDLGKRLEAAVFQELWRRYGTVSYWKQKGEVDFVVTKGDTVTPCQVTLENIEERHLKALDEFKKEFPNSSEPLFITKKNIASFLNPGSNRIGNHWTVEKL